jgi:hypothetical protein
MSASILICHIRLFFFFCEERYCIIITVGENARVDRKIEDFCEHCGGREGGKVNFVNVQFWGELIDMPE